MNRPQGRFRYALRALPPKGTKMTPTIREAVPDDLPAILQMIDLLARHHGETARISLDTLRRQAFELGLARLWVAAEPEGLIGYALVLRRPNMVSGGTMLDLNHLFIHEWRRRAGIGGRLIAAVRAQARAEGAEVLTIGTHPGNTQAQATYRGMGFQELPPRGPQFSIALEAAS